MVIIRESEGGRSHCGALSVLATANKKGIIMLLNYFLNRMGFLIWFYESSLIMPVFQTHSTGVSEFIGSISSG